MSQDHSQKNSTPTAGTTGEIKNGTENILKTIRGDRFFVIAAEKVGDTIQTHVVIRDFLDRDIELAIKNAIQQVVASRSEVTAGIAGAGSELTQRRVN